MDKSVQITGIVVIGIIIMVLAVNSGGSQNTISVTGVSTVEAFPDLVGIYFSVDTQGATSNEASDRNSDIVNTLINSLIAKGFEREDIKTQSFNVYPEYNYQTNTIKGYRAIHSLKVELPADASERIGDIIDSGIDSGAGISYVNFELSSESQSTYKTEAMKLAAQDATAKAEGVAEGLDKNLGSLVSVTINDYGYVPWLAYDASTASGAAEVREAAVSIVPSEQQISASVTAVFKIR